jgi:hypothetical protein
MAKVVKTNLSDQHILRLIHNPKTAKEIPQLRSAINSRRRSKPCCRHRVNARMLIRSVRRTVVRLPAKHKERAFQIMGLR